MQNGAVARAQDVYLDMNIKTSVFVVDQEPDSSAHGLIADVLLARHFDGVSQKIEIALATSCRIL